MSNQFLVGFALENDDELSNAKKVEHEKEKFRFDCELNSFNDHGAGFGKFNNTNKVTVICKSGS